MSSSTASLMQTKCRCVESTASIAGAQPQESGRKNSDVCSNPEAPEGRQAGYLVAGWGVLNVSLILLQAALRLTPVAFEPWRTGVMTRWEVSIYLFWVAFNAY